MSPRPIADIASYHAHIYYDPARSRAQAETLRGWIAERFPVRLGAWHEKAIGPHDEAMFQVSFARDIFATFVPWLMLNHSGLSILLHPNTANPRRDHLDDSIWIGQALVLHGEILPEDHDAEDALEPNTAPHLPA